MSQELTLNSPYIVRFSAWAQERFPFASVISGCLSYITMILIGRYIGSEEAKLIPIDALGAIAFTGHLFILRVFDEHKDFEVDSINHPERALQRGLITLAQLKYIAIFFAGLSLAWSLLYNSNSNTSIITWSIMMVYSLFMAKEFFIGEWLSKRLVLYAISHMLVSPLMMFWILSSGSNSINPNNPVTLVTLLLCLLSGFSYELTRKCRGPEEEKESLDSYTKIMGINKTMTIITILNLAVLGLSTWLLNALRASGYSAYIVLGLGFSSIIYPSINFIKKPSLKARKINEGGLGLYLLGVYVSLLIVLF